MTIVYIWLATHIVAILTYSFILFDGKRSLRFSPEEEYGKIFLLGLVPIVSYIIVMIVSLIYKDDEIHPAYKKIEKAANTLFICGECKLSSRKHQQVTSYYNGENDNYYSPSKKDANNYDFYYSGEERSDYLEFYEEVSNCPHCKNNSLMEIASESLQDSSISFAPKVSPIDAFGLFKKFSNKDKIELRREFLAKTDESFDFAMEQEKLFNKIQQEVFQKDLAKIKSM